jgi:phospholipid/cholesterol/gamma-HCH transport system ATP-binding protein
MADQPLIQVAEMTCGYGRLRILDKVSLTVGKGEILALIGKSGCGKTTLLKTLIGLLPYSAGSVKVMDTEMGDRGAVEKGGIMKRMGVLFQRGALINSMTVAENAALPIEMHTKTPAREIDRIVLDKLKAVRMEHAYYKFPTELSGGMIKRAALARALALDPELLFCDEPSAGLDPVTTRGLDELLLEVRRRFGMTMVVVTHDVASIRRIADRVIMLDKGAIVFDGPKAEAEASEIPALRDFFQA